MLFQVARRKLQNFEGEGEWGGEQLRVYVLIKCYSYGMLIYTLQYINVDCTILCYWYLLVFPIFVMLVKRFSFSFFSEGWHKF